MASSPQISRPANPPSLVLVSWYYEGCACANEFSLFIIITAIDLQLLGSILDNRRVINWLLISLEVSFDLLSYCSQVYQRPVRNEKRDVELALTSSHICRVTRSISLPVRFPYPVLFPKTGLDKVLIDTTAPKGSIPSPQ